MKKKLLLALLVVLALLPLFFGPALAAWPLTPLTTYNAGTTPVIKAADLNSFQSAINDLFLGNKTHKSISIDSVGGTPVVGATPGTLYADVGVYSPSVFPSKVVSNTTTPTPALATGELPRGLVPLGWAKIDATGSFLRGVNVVSEPGARGGVQHPTFGTYTVVFAAKPNDGFNTACMATPTASRFVSCTTDVDGSGRVRANVLTFSVAGVLAEANFQVVLFGE